MDPAGVGPELLAEAWARRVEEGLSPFFVAGGAAIIAASAAQRGIEVPVARIADPSEAAEAFARALPVLKRGGEKVSATISTTVSEQRQSLRANRTHADGAQTNLPLFAGVAVLAVLLLWWLLSDDWNRKTAREAYQDGDLTKTEYNEILAELKKEHQAKLAELREALEDEDLTREEFVEAVKEAKQEYSGEDDCGSWLGC